jgi:hypothetical protein
MKVSNKQQRVRRHIPLADGAQQTHLTPPGLLKILKRTENAIREDGRWYVDPSVVERIARARRVLGLDRHKQSNLSAAN